MSNDIRFISIADAYIGFESVHTSAKGWHKKPAHDLKFLARIFTFAKDFKPNIVILQGDQYHFDYLSKYTKESTVAKFEQLLTKDSILHDKHLINPAHNTGAEEVVYMLGNHDIRTRNLSEKFPALGNIIEELVFPSYITDTIVEQGGIYKIGKLHFIHGDTIKGKYVAQAAVNRYGVNVRLGHFHRHETATLCHQVQPTHSITGIVYPCACNRDPGYLNHAPNSWAKGFAYGFVSKKSGNFNDYVVHDHNGFNIGGKEYS